MFLTNIRPGYAIIFIAAIILLVIYSLWVNSPTDRFSAKRLLTDNEEEFFQRLVRGLPDFYVFPQVAIRAFLRPGSPASQKAYSRQLGRIGAKHCDFLVCNANLDIVAIIELDDRTHNLDQDIRRDAMTGSAGYRTIRYESRQKPTSSTIGNDVAKLVAQAQARG